MPITWDKESKGRWRDKINIWPIIISFSFSIRVSFHIHSRLSEILNGQMPLSSVLLSWLSKYYLFQPLLLLLTCLSPSTRYHYCPYWQKRKNESFSRKQENHDDVGSSDHIIYSNCCIMEIEDCGLSTLYATTIPNRKERSIMRRIAET